MEIPLVWAILLIFAVWSVVAIPRSQFYYYGPDVDSTLPKELESSSPEITLKVPIVFYGDSQDTIFVSTNGVVSFLIDIPVFLSLKFPLDYPVIAPLYSNVDVRGSGNVFYRETDDALLLKRATDNVRASFTVGIDFTATSLFIATWSNVGQYHMGMDKVNTFQLIIASNGTDSYVEYLYADDGIQWIQGTDPESGLVYARAQAGMVAGDGRFFALQNSGRDQIRYLARSTNSNTKGVWFFHIGLLGDSGNVESPDLVNVEAQPTYAETCDALGTTTCHSKARCHDYEAGFCCACNEGFYGNGENCLPDDLHLRVNGKMNGFINDVALNNLDIQSYVVTPEGRTYTAISRVPPPLGYDMQTLNVVGGVIGWLFARPMNNAINGYQLTGGVFNHTSKLTFTQSGHKLTVTQNYMGLDVFDQLKFSAEVNGFIPAIPAGTKIDISEYEEQYVRSAPGTLVSRKTQSFRLEGVPVDNPFEVEQIIHYDECASNPPNITNQQLRVARNLVAYEGREMIIRYGMTSKIVAPGGDDPCTEGHKSCVQHSSCVVDDDSFHCVCNPGYQYLYVEETPESATCVDVNECRAGTHDCHKQALCVNEEGGFSCRCNAGYVGNGRHCRAINCSDIQCHRFAECVEEVTGEVHCRCSEGYVGNGVQCIPSQPEKCIEANDCSPFATCQPDENLQDYVCVCLPGYHGDGYSCSEIRASPSAQPDCSDGDCLCPPDFVLEGLICARRNASLGPHDASPVASPLPCNVINTCHPQAQCVYFLHQATYRCQCNAGYEGDGYECNESDISCVDVDICDAHSTCQYDEGIGKHVCRCNVGYRMEGEFCVAIHECRIDSDCGDNSLCSWSYQFSHYQCICKEGFTLQDGECQPVRGSYCGTECHPFAACLYAIHSDTYKCTCQPGYVGNGTFCEIVPAGCNILKNCRPDTECVYDDVTLGYRCRCKEGFLDTGSRCVPEITCLENPAMCGLNAACVLDPRGFHVCECVQGFRGNGFVCKAIPKSEEKSVLLSQGMAVLRIPISSGVLGESLPIVMKPYQEAIGIAVDCSERRVYWSDITGKVIRSALYNGSDVSVFLKTDLGSLEGLAIDWVSRNIFWTDSEKDMIEVANLDHKGRKIIISEGLVNPRGIAVHPGRGKVFWSDWNRISPKLEWANMDGTERSIFLQGEHVGLPNSLAIDWERDELCWADAGIHAIGCVGLSTHSVRIVVKDISYPFGLTVTSDNYFWTDWSTHKVESAKKYSGIRNEPYSILLRGIGKLYGIVAVENRCPAVTNACEYNLRQCETGQICLPSGYGGYNCTCGDFDGEGSGDEPACNTV